MKALVLLMAFSLTVFTLRGQVLEPKEPVVNYIINRSDISVPKSTYYVVNSDSVCVQEKMEPIHSCVYREPKISSEIPEPKGAVIINKHYNHPYIYNFKGHVSFSFGVKLSEMSISKFRMEWESDTRTEHWTWGGLISFYTLKYYYVGVRPEVFTRFYFVENTSGEGAFLQGRIGWGRFWGDGQKPFGGIGAGIDVGNKIILIGNSRNYINSFTLTPMAGVQVYPGPGGIAPLTWVWQLRFGYQF